MGKVMTSGGTGASVALLFAAALAFPVGSQARAEAGAWAESAHAKVRLVAAVAETGGATSVQLGLEIKLAPGWKTYWRAPGEGGLPPRFDWGGSLNLEKVDIAWPAPQGFEIGGLESVGYAERVILPLEATLARPGEPLALRLALQYAVCREICMLVEARLALDLPRAAAAGAQAAAHPEAIALFRAAVPRPAAAHGWRVTGLRRHRVGGDNGRDVLLIDLASDGAPFTAPWLLLDSPAVRLGKAMRKPGTDERLLRFAAPIPPGASMPDGTEIVLTLIDGPRAGEFRARIEPASR